MRTKVKIAVNETGEFLKFILRVLQVRYFAVAFSIIFFVLIYFITPYYWSHGVSILIAYMVADLIRIIIIDGNNRFIQFNSLMFSRERNERSYHSPPWRIRLRPETSWIRWKTFLSWGGSSCERSDKARRGEISNLVCALCKAAFCALPCAKGFL